MNQHFQNLLEELKKLNFPKDKYVIFGSGILSALNIREASDLDIIIKSDIFEDLWNKYPEYITDKPYRCLNIGGIEIIDKLNNDEGYESVNRIIDNAIVIDGFPYITLEDLKIRKAIMGREKDLKDIELINEYLKNNKI